MKKKKMWIWILSIVGLLAIATVVAFVVTKKDSKQQAGAKMEVKSVSVQKAAERELIETILVTGEIVPEGEQKVFIEPEKGDIKEYKVEENQTVKAGAPLFVYNSTKLEAELKKAVREKDLIQKRAKTEQSQIADLTKQIKEAKKNNASSTNNGEPTEASNPVDANQLEKEKIQMELQYENTKSEIASAQERINEVTAQIKDMTVVSKIDGIVVKVNRNIAKTETGGAEPVVHIISSKPYKVIGTMTEFDAVKIQNGQEVIIRPKVFKDREWKGVVESVSQFPNENGGNGEFPGGMGGGNVTMYPFKVGITDDTSELRQGFHVSLEVKVSGNGKSLVIPHTAIMDMDGMTMVYVLVDGKLEKRPIKTGKMNDQFIEVIEGIKTGELVVLSPDQGMHEGMEVTSFDEVE